MPADEPSPALQVPCGKRLELLPKWLPSLRSQQNAYSRMRKEHLLFAILMCLRIWRRARKFTDVNLHLRA